MRQLPIKPIWDTRYSLGIGSLTRFTNAVVFPATIKADLRSRNWIGYMCREIGKHLIAARLIWHLVSVQFS